MARNPRLRKCSAGCAIKALHLLITIFCSVISYFLIGTFSHDGGEVPFCFAPSPSSFTPPCVFWGFSKLSDIKLRHFFVFSPKIPFSSGNIVDFCVFILENLSSRFKKRQNSVNELWVSLFWFLSHLSENRQKTGLCLLRTEQRYQNITTSFAGEDWEKR